ncbi:MAG: pyridoxamine 5'-phosphate oxidase family protein [Anaerolineae bacterium]|nr:pyridoxamine 5'-phosphate oxidase family protein [Anaerolineae bacterium]
MTDPRLLSERNIWLATVRPDGRPHLVPIWFVWVRERIYICTESRSVKVRNIAANPRASAALENGNQPIIAEGRATVLHRPYPGDVVAEFKQKYGWDISADGSYNALIEITPEKWLRW